jgi:predicted metalloprotease
MRWRTGRRSRNIEDRRIIRVPRKVAGGGIGIVVIALIAMYFGVPRYF